MFTTKGGVKKKGWENGKGTRKDPGPKEAGVGRRKNLRGGGAFSQEGAGSVEEGAQTKGSVSGPKLAKSKGVWRENMPGKIDVSQMVDTTRPLMGRGGHGGGGQKISGNLGKEGLPPLEIHTPKQAFFTLSPPLKICIEDKSSFSAPSPLKISIVGQTPSTQLPTPFRDPCTKLSPLSFNSLVHSHSPAIPQVQYERQYERRNCG